MKRILVLLPLFCLFSCNQEQSKETMEFVENNNEVDTIEEDYVDYESKVFNEGDTSAYNSFRVDRLKLKEVNNFLFYPLIMANKFDYSLAHIDVFNTLLDCYVQGDLKFFNEIDDKTKELMNYHLERAESLGSLDAEKIRVKLMELELNKQDNFIVKPSEMTIEDKIFFEGDIDAYKSLRWEFHDFAPQDYLFWPLLMANKYDYSEAYSDVFYAIYDGSRRLNSKGFDSLDEKTKSFALEYLNTAIEKGVEVSEEIIEEVN